MTKRSKNLPERIQRVVGYLTEHLDDALSLEALARVAHLSPYHFHRIYRGLLSETVSDTVRRLRLQRSAIDLLDRNLNIDRVARRAGYASHAAFTRAFRAEYGAPPASYRGAQRTARRDQATDRDLYRVEGVALPRLRLAAIHHRGNYQLASKAFERLMTVAAATGLLTQTTRTIGIYHDDPVSVPQTELRSTACITVSDEWVPSGELAEAFIEGGR